MGQPVASLDLLASQATRLPIEGLEIAPWNELHVTHAPFLGSAMDQTQIGLKVWELHL